MNKDKKRSLSFSEETLREFLKIKTDHNQKLESLIYDTNHFCRSVLNREPHMMILTGDSGVAKTHTLKKLGVLFRMVGLYVWQSGGWGSVPDIQFLDWSDIAIEDRSDNDFKFEDACNCDVLLLDDLGSEIDKFKSDEPKERLRKLLGRRENKISAITTNIAPENWFKTWDKRVEDRLLRGNSTVVNLWGVPSFSEVL